MSPSIIPVAKSLYICDGTIGFANQKTDLMGIFNAIRPQQYPHLQKHFVAFSQLLGGLGQVPFYFDVRYAADNTLMNADTPRPMHQPETFFIGELQEFTGTFLSPDDPSLEPRVRRGRPADSKRDPRYDLPEEENGK